MRYRGKGTGWGMANGGCGMGAGWGGAGGGPMTHTAGPRSVRPAQIARTGLGRDY